MKTEEHLSFTYRHRGIYD